MPRTLLADADEIRARELQRAWPSPPLHPPSDREAFVKFLGQQHFGAGDEQLINERYGDRYSDAQATMAALIEEGIKVVDLLATERSGAARDDAEMLGSLQNRPAWGLEFAAFVLHGYSLDESASRKAIAVLLKARKAATARGEKGFIECERVLETYKALREAFSPDYEAPPSEIIHVAAMWSADRRPPMPVLCWTALEALTRELKRRDKNRLWWEKRAEDLKAYKKRAAKKSLQRRAEALVWLLSTAQWPDLNGNRSQLAQQILKLVETRIAGLPKRPVVSVVTGETIEAVLDRGAQEWGAAATDGNKGPKIGR